MDIEHVNIIGDQTVAYIDKRIEEAAADKYDVLMNVLKTIRSGITIDDLHAVSYNEAVEYAATIITSYSELFNNVFLNGFKNGAMQIISLVYDIEHHEVMDAIDDLIEED